jgi:very-short-patch-repair endonuclease
MDAYVQTRWLDERIAGLADRDHGIVDVEGLRSLGASRTQIGRRLDAMRFVRLHRGVYAVGHRRLTKEGWWLAAVRAIGPGAVLSHVHAAAMFDLRPAPGGRINVTVVSSGRRPRKGIRVHSVRELPAGHVTVRNGIPVTTVARTLADLAGTVEQPQLARAVEAADALQLLDVPSVHAVSAGRPGANRLRRLLEEDPPHTRSDFEAAFNELCDRYGLPRPAMNTQFHGYEVDCVWLDHNLVVELDSYRFHRSRAAFERDRERDAELHALGVATLRFTYRQVTTRHRWVATKLRPSLAPRSRRGSSSLRRSAA